MKLKKSNMYSSNEWLHFYTFKFEDTPLWRSDYTIFLTKAYFGELMFNTLKHKLLNVQPVDKW